jgi:hypothetical protein
MHWHVFWLMAKNWRPLPWHLSWQILVVSFKYCGLIEKLETVSLAGIA